MDQRYFVYILTNSRGTVLYTGVTNDLFRRVGEHAGGIGSVFTKRYGVSRLVYFEEFGDVRQAIAREKQIKKWGRSKKEELVRSRNPRLVDLMRVRA